MKYYENVFEIYFIIKMYNIWERDIFIQKYLKKEFLIQLEVLNLNKK